MSTTFLGLRTACYRAPDLSRSRDFYRAATGVEPYFDEPFYVGFNIAGFELGLDPDMAGSGEGGTGVYWGVPDIEAAMVHLAACGAREHTAIRDVGGGIKVASVLDPAGNVLGVIENPHFGG
jgi:catechol 2,3-dioxygenase-like lactoylglutathione lyase family enzyme